MLVVGAPACGAAFRACRPASAFATSIPEVMNAYMSAGVRAMRRGRERMVRARCRAQNAAEPSSVDIRSENNVEEA